ncbi:Spy/CpxP family protein refolding chaperone [Accumulibacter sp.]|uniref:Spy/CpxP family protein refolding chaperone n=1 Tax=Accumulibacter sp. TaxID=2053492 RepID=UPI001D3BC622|nr:Spy/CpxP family protein refolding chaperone [Accumulibacter sp.]MCB1967597.1 Spy/CpxP family protein refolding chaperone [Accumulibacter sp.]MCP5227874.1 Spy/CpxP family protein refolding chaperone [Accumulibacter sp.]
MNTFKRTLAVFLATSSIALALPPAAHAGPMAGGGMDGGCQGHGAMRGQRDGLPPMMKDLKLSPEQETRISELRKQDSALLSEKYESMRDSRRQLREMQKKGDYDEAQVKALTEKGALAMAEMAQLRARQHHQMMEILTPEQRTQFEEQRERMAQRWERKRGGRPPA